MADTPSSLNADALRKALDRLHIQDLALRKASVDVDPDGPMGLDGKSLDVQLKWGARNARMVGVSHEGKSQGVLLLVEIETSVRLVDKPTSEEASAEPRVRALIDASFVATYRVTDGPELEEEAINEFSTKNVIYHVWPYWREYVSDTLGRAHLPPFTLPMFRFKAPDPKPAGTD